MRIYAAIILMTCTSVFPLAAAAQSNTGMSPKHHQSTTYEHGTASMQQFKSEADARKICDNGNVAWMNTRNYVLHFPGDTYYGKSKHGAYVCTRKQ